VLAKYTAGQRDVVCEQKKPEQCETTKTRTPLCSYAMLFK